MGGGPTGLVGSWLEPQASSGLPWVGVSNAHFTLGLAKSFTGLVFLPLWGHLLVMA